MLCQSVIPPGKLPLSFVVKDIEPRDDPHWQRATPAQRHAFWKIAGRIAFEVKQRELSKGLDYSGKPLRPVTVRNTRYKSGDMLDGPPLMPHRTISRTRRLLRYFAQATMNQIRFYWAMDWGKVLDYHRRGAVIKRGGRCVGRLPVRNVFGISKKGRDEIASRAYLEWRGDITPTRRIIDMSEHTNLAVSLPRDTGRAKKLTPDDFLAMGIRVTTNMNKNRVVMRDSAPQAAAGPVVQRFGMVLDWSTLKRQRRKAAKP